MREPRRQPFETLVPVSELTEVPPPELVAAWHTLGMLDSGAVPMWAAHWLTQGFDGPALRELAGLPSQDPRAIADMLPVAVAEAGVSTPTSVSAAAKVAFDDLARRLLDGRVSWRGVIAGACDIVVLSNFADPVWDQELSVAYGIADELDGDWGRTTEELEQAVHQAAVSQLQPKDLE
jgi:hypothetical protein